MSGFPGGMRSSIFNVWLHDPISETRTDSTGRLMNHTNINLSLGSHIQRAKTLPYLGHPYILGELNSIARRGIDGETNVFEDALWLVGFPFWAAAHIRILMSLNSWKMVLHANNVPEHQTPPFPPGPQLPLRLVVTNPRQEPGWTTRPPYYGQIMVASALSQQQDARIVNIPLDGDIESAYAIYNGDRLTRLAVVDLQAFNKTSSAARPSRQYEFEVPRQYSQARFERLIAPGSDALKEVTFAGISHDYDLKKGRPVVLDLKDEVVRINDGVLCVDVPDASAVLVSLS